MSKKLANWKKAFLSMRGRLTLISEALNALPMYYMSLFRIPKSIAEVMEKIMRGFLWNEVVGDSHCHLVNVGIGNMFANRKKQGFWVFGTYV